MEREAAFELANLWHELPEVDAPGNAYEQVTGAVRQFLPDSVTRGSAGMVNGVPAVVAFDSDSFYLIQPETAEDGPSSVLLASRYPRTEPRPRSQSEMISLPSAATRRASGRSRSVLTRQ